MTHAAYRATRRKLLIRAGASAAPIATSSLARAQGAVASNPVHGGAADRHRQCIQRIVRASSGSKPIREPKEVFLVDGIEHRDERTLNDLVFQRGNTQRTLLIGTRLGNEPSPDGQRPISAAMDSCVQVLKVALQPHLVVLPCHAINPGGGTALERQERLPQQVDCDVVQQRSELLLLPLPCSVPYTVQPL